MTLPPLLTRYGMPEPARVVDQFVEYREVHGEDVPAVGQIRENLDTSTADLGELILSGEKTDAEIRTYLREILNLYDARVG